MAYLSYFCNIVFKDDVFKVTFKDSVIYNKKLEAPEVFKIIFDENKKVISIENINYMSQDKCTENYSGGLKLWKILMMK